MPLSGGPTVPMSKHQLGYHERSFAIATPGTGELHGAACTILEVYTQSILVDAELPQEIRNEIDKYPNKLFAKVRLHDGRIFYRPFQETLDQVYATYGNAPLLRGRNARMVFPSTKINRAQIVLTDDYSVEPVNIPYATETWDIGLLT